MKHVFRNHPALLLLALIAIFIPACGVKGPVKPLLPHLPESPGNLTIRQIGDYFLVSWTIPKTNEDGTPLENLQGFDVYKTRFKRSSDCPKCNQSQDVFRRLDLEFLQNAMRKGDKIIFRDSDLRPEFGYLYTVTPFNQKGRDGNSATEKRLFLASPPSPENVQTRHEQARAVLSWSPAPTEKAEAGFLGYNIYRQESGGDAPLNPLNDEYWADFSFTDKKVKSGKTYMYTLRSVWRLDGLVVESGDSTPSTLTLPENH